MEIFGIPAHPFLVHVPVVLVPLAALGVVITCWRKEWRRWFILPLLGMALIGAVFSIFAANSGEDLEHAVKRGASAAERDRIEEHAEAGEMARNLSLLFAVTAAGLGAVVYLDERKKATSWAPVAAYAVVVLAGAAATIGMVNAGHSGAGAAWKDRVTETTAASQLTR